MVPPDGQTGNTISTYQVLTSGVSCYSKTIYWHSEKHKNKISLMKTNSSIVNGFNKPRWTINEDHHAAGALWQWSTYFPPLAMRATMARWGVTFSTIALSVFSTSSRMNTLVSQFLLSSAFTDISRSWSRGSAVWRHHHVCMTTIVIAVSLFA